MKSLHGRVAPLLAAATLLVATTACTEPAPASTPQESAPAALFSHKTVEAAWQTAVARRRPLVVMFTSEHCPHCDRMLAETYRHPQISRYLAERAETVLAHAQSNRELVRRLGIRGYPTSVVVSADGQIVDAVEGFVEPAAFAKRLGRWLAPAGVGGATATATAAR